MMQEASTDNSFEIIEQTQNEQQNYDPTKAEANMGPISGITPVPMFNPNLMNLVSSVPPPTALPSFISPTPIPNLVQQPPQNPQPIMPPLPIPSTISQPTIPIAQQPPTGNFYPTTFSAAIPPNKGTTLGTVPPPSTSVPLSPEVSDDNQGGIFNWMKGAVSSGGLLSKVAEKAKNSVDSMITTLDPQMREFIYSGGDMEIIVASTKEVKVSPIREAFQNIFGKATVTGVDAQASKMAAQPVGFAAGAAAANARISSVHNNPNTANIPTIAVENFVLQVEEDKWFDLGVLILRDPVRQILLQTYTQMTPIPSTIVNLAHDETPKDYPHSESGFSIPIGRLLANNLQVSHTEWHEAVCGVSRRVIILNAAKALAGMYKISINQQS